MKAQRHDCPVCCNKKGPDQASTLNQRQHPPGVCRRSVVPFMRPKLTQTNTPRVVIVGLDNYVGLQSARIFARRNIPVIGVARFAKHFACRTNVCEKIIFADTYNDSLIETLVSLGKTLRQKAVLVPCRDISVSVVSMWREKLEPYYHFLLPKHQLVETLIDKEGFSKLASLEGLRIPKTVVLQDSATTEKAAIELKYPCVIKPGIKNDRWEKATKKKVFKVFSQEEFIEAYEIFKHFSDTLIAQEWIAGEDTNLYSCNGYFGRNSEPIVTFVNRKLRQWPPYVGQASLAVECRNDDVLIEFLRFLEKVDFVGLGSIEFKKDEITGEYYFIEANIGRPTGKSALAEACGVEFLYSMYCDLVGCPLPEERQQLYLGTKWVRLSTDLLSSVALWRSGELSAREWFKSLKGEKCYAIWSFHDPLPFVAQGLWGLRSLIGHKK